MSGSCSRRHQRDLVSAMQLLVIPLIFFYCFLWLPQHFQAAPMPPPPSSPSSWTDKKNTDATHKWQKLAKAHITRHFSGNPRAQPVAKNVILFIGDGMGLTTVTAARIFKSQFKAQQSSENFQDEEEIKSEEPEWTQSAEEDELSFEKFEHVALSKTYNLDSQVGESGACATALMSGVKANFETIGLSGLAKHNNCTSTFVEGGRVSSIAEWAQQQ
ncbi:PREDICTED: alkaline phosphatase, placental-like, partial [Rhagoletis zephyria]|uniref:alkaline phosphatase, placental-like n=1 Tax=Rhagoletis zephyria TaxID=28612 RepID=UPI0008114153